MRKALFVSLLAVVILGISPSNAEEVSLGPPPASSVSPEIKNRWCTSFMVAHPDPRYLDTTRAIPEDPGSQRTYGDIASQNDFADCTDDPIRFYMNSDYGRQHPLQQR